MPPMPICERFEIAIVPFPFVDSAQHKRRPALCLSSGDFMRANGHGLFAMVTSACFSHWPSDVPFERLAGRLAEPDRAAGKASADLLGT